MLEEAQISGIAGSFGGAIVTMKLHVPRDQMAGWDEVMRNTSGRAQFLRINKMEPNVEAALSSVPTNAKQRVENKDYGTW